MQKRWIELFRINLQVTTMPPPNKSFFVSLEHFPNIVFMSYQIALTEVLEQGRF